MDEAMLRVLCCPVTRQSLSVAPAELLVLINQRLVHGTPGTSPEAAPWQEALVRADGTMAYPVRDGIPVLLAEAAVPL